MPPVLARPAALAAAASLLLAAAAPAAAGGPPGTVEPTYVEPPPPTREVRYGHHVLLADLAWIAGSIALGQADDDGADGAAAIMTLGFYGAGPAVHLAHGNRDGALKSLGARALLPIAGMLVGAVAVSSSSSSDCAPEAYDCDDTSGFEVALGAVLGGAVGAGTALVLDWTVLSKKTVRDERPAGWAGVRPGVAVTGKGVSVSLGGTF